MRLIGPVGRKLSQQRAFVERVSGMPPRMGKLCSCVTVFGTSWSSASLLEGDDNCRG